MPLGKSPAFNQLRQRILDARAVFEAVLGSYFLISIVILLIVGWGTQLLDYLIGITIPGKWRQLVAMAAMIGMTIQILLPVVLAFVPSTLINIWGGSSVVVNALGGRAADYVIATCGVEEIPIGAILVMMINPLVLFEYGLRAFCLVQGLFVLSIEILIMTSFFKRYRISWKILVIGLKRSVQTGLQ